MTHRVEHASDEKLREVAQQPNNIVMQPTWDVQFEPWPAQRVSLAVDSIVTITKDMTPGDATTEAIQERCKRQQTLREFSEKYQLIFKKLTDKDFVGDDENLRVLKKMILIKAAVDSKTLSMESAQAQVSDIALNSLRSRVDSQQQPGSSSRRDDRDEPRVEEVD